jgi:hypothetical protein
MGRRANGQGYDFVGIRDRGDGVIGPKDLIIVRDEEGQRHEYYLGDDQARNFLKGMGAEVEEIEGLPWGQAQNRLAYLHHMQCAMRKAKAGDAAGLDAELSQAERCARMAQIAFDLGRAQEMRSLLNRH